jgi:hypothetical protein
VRDAYRTPKSTIAELGLTKQQNRDFKDMAAVPAEAIHQAVEIVNAESRPVIEAEIRRAGGKQAAGARGGAVHGRA